MAIGLRFLFLIIGLFFSNFVWSEHDFSYFPPDLEIREFKPAGVADDWWIAGKNRASIILVTPTIDTLPDFSLYENGDIIRSSSDAIYMRGGDQWKQLYPQDFNCDQHFIFGDGVSTEFEWHPAVHEKYPLVQIRESVSPYREVIVPVQVTDNGVVKISLSSAPEEDSLTAYLVQPDFVGDSTITVHNLDSRNLAFTCYDATGFVTVSPVTFIDNNTVEVTDGIARISIAQMPESMFLASGSSVSSIDTFLGHRNAFATVLGATEGWGVTPMSFNEMELEVSVNSIDGVTVAWKPLNWCNQKLKDTDTDTRGDTIVVAAYNAYDTSKADLICDGVDDQDTINSAINLLSNGGTIRLSDGLFNLTDSIEMKSYICIIGQGIATAVKRVSSFTTGMFNATGTRVGCLISDLYIFGNGYSFSGSCITGNFSFLTCTNVKAENAVNFFYGCLSSALFENCWFYTFDYGFVDDDAASFGLSQVQFESCHFLYCDYVFFEETMSQLSVNKTDFLGYSSNAVFQNCSGYDRKNRFTDNYVSGYDDIFIVDNLSSWIISNCTFLNIINDFINTEDLIDVRICDNRFESIGGSFAVLSNKTGTISLCNIEISNNTVVSIGEALLGPDGVFNPSAASGTYLIFNSNKILSAGPVGIDISSAGSGTFVVTNNIIGSIDAETFQLYSHAMPTTVYISGNTINSTSSGVPVFKFDRSAPFITTPRYAYLTGNLYVGSYSAISESDAYMTVLQAGDVAGATTYFTQNVYAGGNITAATFIIE